MLTGKTSILIIYPKFFEPLDESNIRNIIKQGKKMLIKPIYNLINLIGEVMENFKLGWAFLEL
jgi:hypothetical protein